MKRRALVAIAAPTLLAATIVSSISMGARLGRADDESPLVSAPATSSHVDTVPDSKQPRSVVTLPQPDAPPADPYADVPIVQVGTISIPAIGLEHPIYEGVWLTVIDEGPGHWPGSAMPGSRGNTVFPGHRVTHSHPFLDLDLLVPGDEIVFRTAAGEFTYVVLGTQIVAPTDIWVIDPTRGSTVTLIACHPKHSARQRIVVKGALVRSVPTPGATSSTTATVGA